MSNKYLIIAICAVLCLCILFGYTRAESVDRIGDLLDHISSLSNKIIDVGGYVDNENGFNRRLVDGMFGVYIYKDGDTTKSIDIAKYIRENYLPAWLANNESVTDIKIEISPHLWSFTRTLSYESSGYIYVSRRVTKDYDNVTNAMRIYVTVSYDVTRLENGIYVTRNLTSRVQLVVWSANTSLNIMLSANDNDSYSYGKSYVDTPPTSLGAFRAWINVDNDIVAEITGNEENVDGITYGWFPNSFNTVGMINSETFPFIYY